MYRVLLAKYRGERSQEDVALDSGISQGYYSSIESGKRIASPKVAAAIGKTLKIPLSDIFNVFYNKEVAA